MKIESIHIDGFGVWQGRQLGPLAPGINVFHGPNETGKTTLMSFIRSILFGFERRGHARRYEPLRGGVHGGWLDLSVQGQRIRVERKPGRHVRGTVNVYGNVPAATVPAGSAPLLFELPEDPHNATVTGHEEELEKLLGGTTRTLFHNVFAFGLDELEHFHTLEDNEVAAHISGAGLGIGAARWASVHGDLEERAGTLFMPRGQTASINLALKDLEAVRDELDRTEHEPGEYWQAHDARQAIEQRVGELQAEAVRGAAEVEKLARHRQAIPRMERRRKLKAQLAALDPVESFPEGGVERLNLLLHQLRGLEGEEARCRRELEQRRLRRRELAGKVDPLDLERRQKVIEELRTRVPQASMLRTVVDAAEERVKAIDEERVRMSQHAERSRPPSFESILAFVVMLWVAAVGLQWIDQSYLAGALLIASLAPLLLYRRRRTAADEIHREVALCVERANLARDEADRKRGELRELDLVISRLTGRSDIGLRDVETRAAELDRLHAIRREVQLFDEATSRAEADLAHVRRQMEEISVQMRHLLDEGGAGSENDFLARANVFRRRQQILTELDKISAESDAAHSGVPDGGAVEDQWVAARAELADLEARLAEARREAGRLDERIAMMERSEERSRLLAKRASILTRVESSAEQWAILTLCRTLLDETRKIYESERQPEVLRVASRFFSIMTDGRYAKVIAPLDGSEILVEKSDGARLSPGVLSRGTAEQLYLAMRLALVREYARHVEALPVVLDDILVNFDPDRVACTLRALADLSETHQILMFTCHPSLVGAVQEIVPAAKVIPLQ